MPLSPKPTTSFMDLLIKLRTSIYELALLKSSPIIVWSATCERVVNDDREMPAYLSWDRDSMSSSREDLTLNLLGSNSTISYEAAAVFYSRNIFTFRGDHEWIEIISWLSRIGLRNRTLLRRLNISVGQPSLSWQMPNGSRRQLFDGSMYQFWPRSASLTHLSYPVPEGEVENISPAIETLIAILTRAEDNVNVTSLRLTPIELRLAPR